ncbi:MAG TPA: hypothetical protein VM368_06530 [Flavisolibacter sp.]|nr:hypothetical protein [Flavisolibacter sp.]
MQGIHSLVGGLAGATVLTIVHEVTKKIDPDAPRLDLLGMQGITKGLKFFHIPIPQRDKLFKITMAGDIISNGIYYSMAGVSSAKNVVYRSSLMGFMAGIGALSLPKHLGLREAPDKRTPKTAVLTVVLYTIGGMAAGITMLLLQRNKP